MGSALVSPGIPDKGGQKQVKTIHTQPINHDFPHNIIYNICELDVVFSCSKQLLPIVRVSKCQVIFFLIPPTN